MENKKDIGKLFEDKLQFGKKEPNTKVWERLNISLDAEKRKREKIMYYWFTAIGVVLLLGVILIINIDSKEETNKLTDQKKDNASESTLKKEVVNTANNLKTSIIDTLNNSNKKVESTSNSNVSVENSEGDKIENAKENILKSN